MGCKPCGDTPCNNEWCSFTERIMKNYTIRTERFQDKTYVMLSVEDHDGSITHSTKTYTTANKVEELLSMIEKEMQDDK